MITRLSIHTADADSDEAPVPVTVEDELHGGRSNSRRSSDVVIELSSRIFRTNRTLASHADATSAD